MTSVYSNIPYRCLQFFKMSEAQFGASDVVIHYIRSALWESLPGLSPAQREAVSASGRVQPIIGSAQTK